MLWISIAPGNISTLFDPESPTALIHSLRAVSPFIAAFFASVFILWQIYWRREKGFEFVSPLGLAVAYGLVGMVAISVSPDASVAFRWVALYLSVPLVLWSIAWQQDAFDKIFQILNITWICVTLGSLALFAVGLIYLDLFDVIKEPHLILECRSGNWHGFFNGGLRDTGVGRYAAIAALVSISVVFQRKWWPISITVLVLSVFLLVFTGARGAMAGFAVASVLTVLLYGGKKSVLYGSLTMVVLFPIIWGTGSHRVFYENCILSGQVGQRSQALKIEPPSIAASPEVAVPVPYAIPAPNTVTSETLSQPEPSTVVVKIPETLSQPEPSTVVVKIPETLSQPEPSTVVVKIPATKVPDEIDFFTFTGRTSVWKENLQLFKDSPIVGRGFHADRIILDAHVHNSVIQSLVQTGLIGAILFIGSVAFGWLMFLDVFRNLTRLPENKRHLVIQCGAILAFLTVRSLPESTGTFFGIDWLILAPILLYLHLAHRALKSSQNY